MARHREPRRLREIARARLLQAREPTPADYEEDRRLEAAGCTVLRSGDVRIVIDLTAGLDDAHSPVLLRDHSPVDDDRSISSI